MEWFAVTEKLPNPGDTVRAFNGKVAMTMLVDIDRNFIPFPEFPDICHNVTHWAYEPLPGPVLQIIKGE